MFQRKMARAHESALGISRQRDRNLTLSRIGPWSWFVCDFVIAFVCAAIAFSLTPYNIEFRQEAFYVAHVGRLEFCFGAGLLIAFVSHISGLHETRQGCASLRLLGHCARVSSIALLFLNLELLLVHYLLVGRLITFYTFIGSTMGLFMVRALVGLVVRKHYVVGFIGSEKFTGMVREFGRLDFGQGLTTVALTMKEGAPVDLPGWALENHVSQIVFDPNDTIRPSRADLLELLDISLSVVSYSNYVEKLYQRIPSDFINAQWVIDCQEELAVPYKMAIKRVLDIVIASIALVILLPLGLVAAIFVKLDSPGPVIYRQTRVGQFGRPFTMLKLRTMVEQAENGGAKWATEFDSRITAVGQFLRRSRLDEIPQLLNVLAGEMSLVGPSPERPEFKVTLESRIPFFAHRVLVKPGITGWAQVNRGFAASEAETATKLSFDFYYIKNLSLGLDLRILLRTISSFNSGARYIFPSPSYDYQNVKPKGIQESRRVKPKPKSKHEEHSLDASVHYESDEYEIDLTNILENSEGRNILGKVRKNIPKRDWFHTDVEYIAEMRSHTVTTVNRVTLKMIHNVDVEEFSNALTNFSRMEMHLSWINLIGGTTKTTEKYREKIQIVCVYKAGGIIRSFGESFRVLENGIYVSPSVLDCINPNCNEDEFKMESDIVTSFESNFDVFGIVL